MSDVENNEEVQKAQEDGVVSGAEEEITQECRLEELYNQVCEEAEERDKKMREYTELQFDGLRKFMEESLGDLIPKKAPSSVTAPQVDVTLPQIGHRSFSFRLGNSKRTFKQAETVHDGLPQERRYFGRN